MPTQKEELQLNTQQDMSSEDMYVLKKLFTEYVSLYRLELNSGKYEILEQCFRERQHLKIGQHRVHTHDAARRLNQHAGRASHRADSNKQRPENQPLIGAV